jgi:hypothetical protein
MREQFMKTISKHPEFQEAQKSGKAFVIVVDLSHYSEAEREIIDYLQRCEGRPLTQEEK